MTEIKVDNLVVVTTPNDGTANGNGLEAHSNNGAVVTEAIIETSQENTPKNGPSET